LVGWLREANTEEENNGNVVFKRKSLGLTGKKGGDGGYSTRPHPFQQQASGQMFKEVVKGFFSISDFCFIWLTFFRAGDLSLRGCEITVSMKSLCPGTNTCKYQISYDEPICSYLPKISGHFVIFFTNSTSVRNKCLFFHLKLSSVTGQTSDLLEKATGQKHVSELQFVGGGGVNWRSPYMTSNIRILNYLSMLSAPQT
jgi:hypothetical protein